MIIQLYDDYYIETDQFNFALKQSYTGRTRTGDEKEASRTIGYYASLESALNSFLRLERSAGKEDAVISLSEYIKTLNEADKKNRECLRGLIGGIKFEQ